MGPRGARGESRPFTKVLAEPRCEAENPEPMGHAYVPYVAVGSGFGPSARPGMTAS